MICTNYNIEDPTKLRAATGPISVPDLEFPYYNRMRLPLGCLLLIVATHAYLIDSGATGRRLDGFGAISGGGATSRLLFSYPQPQLDQILNFLFKPQFGLSLHHLKVEIGGDGQSSEGVESSHQHSENDLSYQRGYEWRLMVEARKRNPAILLSGLAWTFPGWVGAGTSSPWTNISLTAGYIIAWLQGARSTYALDIDFINADMNERG